MVSTPHTLEASAALHYIYDPLCGWCYAAAPLIAAARQRLKVLAHGGGMMSGERRQPVTPQLREFVRPHDQHIAALSGQPFGAAYIDGLLRDPQAVFDSDPPTAAVLAAEQLAGLGLDMLAALQAAHYVEGRRIADVATLRACAQTLGLDAAHFDAALAALQGSALALHFQATRALMERHGAQGFPTLLLEQGGAMRRVELRRFLGKPAQFVQWLEQQLGEALTEPAPADPVCSADACQR